MENILVTSGFVKKLANNIRTRYGRELRHTEVIELIADALGCKAGPLMHRLKSQVADLVPGVLHTSKQDAAKPFAGLSGSQQETIRAFIETNELCRPLEGVERDPGDGMNTLLISGARRRGLAHHVAHELLLPLAIIDRSDIQSIGAEASLAWVEEIIDRATLGSRCLLFIDGIDLSVSRNGKYSTLATFSQALPALLDRMPNGLVVIVGVEHMPKVGAPILRRCSSRVRMEEPNETWAQCVLLPQSLGEASANRRYAALVLDYGTGRRVLLVAENHENSVHTSCARMDIRRKGGAWDIEELASFEDIAALYNAVASK